MSKIRFQCFELLKLIIMSPIFDAIWDTPLYVPVIIYGIVIASMGYLSFHWYWNTLSSTLGGDDSDDDKNNSKANGNGNAKGKNTDNDNDNVIKGNINVDSLDSKRAARAFWGAMFFILSDSVLAWAKFVPSILNLHGYEAHDVVMVTYYIAQGLIVSCVE